jgi:filamentous hemagglutinin family protein
MRLKSSLRIRFAAGAALAMLSLAGGASALPTPIGAVVNAGGGQPVISGNNDDLVTIDLNAQRTIIDWSNFDLADHETARFAFDQRNWIVLNRVTSGPINIDGMVQAVQAANANATGPIGGNVWFYSPQGVAFGPSTRVDVGGLLATTAAVDQTAFLNTGNLNMPFTGSGSGGPVTIAGGALFNSPGGHLAFVAPQVSSGAGSSVNAGNLGTAAYGAVDSYEIRFVPIGNNDLAFFTFLVPGVAAGTPHATPMNLSGTTRGANVYLTAISRQGLAGMLINAPGLIEGRSSVASYGQVTITTGRNITLGQVNEASTPVVGAQTGHVQLGRVDADGNVNIYLEGASGSGNVQAESVRSGQGFLIVANDVTTGPGGLTAGDANVNLGALRIVAAGTVDVPFVQARTNFDIFPGVARGVGNTVTQPLIRLGTASAGGFISFTNTRAITAQSLTAGGTFTVANAVSLTANTIASGADLFVTGTNGALDIGSGTATGQAQLFSNSSVRLGTLTTNGYTRVSSSTNITATTIRGLDLDLRSAGGVTATSLIGTNSVSLGTGGDAIVSSITGPSLLLDANLARLGTVTVANDVRFRVDNLDITGALSANNLTIEAKSGNITLGGTTEPGLTQAEINRISLRGVMNIYAGFTAATVNVPTPVFGTLEVRDLTIDPVRIPRLALFANQAQAVRVTGALKASAAGGDLQIGAPEVDSPWAPGQIVVTGAIGSARGDAVAGFTEVQAFDNLELHATRDILMGSQRFLDLIGDASASDIDIGRGLPLGVAAQGDEIGKLFVVAGNLTLTANERIVQQNTGVFGFEGGLYLTGVGVEADDPILTIGRAQVADLFGAFDSGDGVLAIGGAGAFSSRIARLEGDTSAGQIRINGCLLGIGCAISTPSSQFRIQQFRPAAPRAAVDPPVLTPPPPVDDDEREAEAVTTGAGNEEIWRKDPQ